MSRSHYTFAIIFLGLGLAASIFQSFLYLRIDSQIFIQESFRSWLIVTNIVGLVGSVLLLKYYHFKKFGLAFKTGVVVTVVTVCQFIVIYVILVAAGKLQALYLPIVYVLLIAAVAHATTLIFSQAKKNHGSWRQAF